MVIETSLITFPVFEAPSASLAVFNRESPQISRTDPMTSLIMPTISFSGISPGGRLYSTPSGRTRMDITWRPIVP